MAGTKERHVHRVRKYAPVLAAAAVLTAGLSTAMPAAASPAAPQACGGSGATTTTTGVLKDTATYEIQCPAGHWNGQLFLYSHGYVVPGSANPAQDAQDPTTAGWLLSQGFALAGSSYATTGWAIQQALPDQIATKNVFSQDFGRPAKTIAWGDSLGGIITSDPAVVVNSDGRLEVFARGTDNALWHIWQTAPHAGPWSAWASLGGIITSDPATFVNSDGRIEVFARGTDNALWHIWQTAPHTGPWSAWASLGGIITSDPAVADNSDGRLEVFARGTDNALWHIWQTVPHAGPWSAWGSLGGGITSDPVVIDNSDGRDRKSVV